MFCTKCGSPVTGSFCATCGAPVAGAPQAPASPAPAPQPAYTPPAPVYGAVPPPGLFLDYARWGTRVAGYLIDWLFVAGAVAVLIAANVLLTGSTALLQFTGGHHFASPGVCCVFGAFPLASLLVGLWNKVYLVAQRGSSVGQGVMDIMVVNAQGQVVTLGTAAIRLVAHTAMSFVPFLGAIDLLWPLWDERRQTLHDKVANSYVINRPGGAA